MKGGSTCAGMTVDKIHLEGGQYHPESGQEGESTCRNQKTKHIFFRGVNIARNTGVKFKRNGGVKMLRNLQAIDDKDLFRALLAHRASYIRVINYDEVSAENLKFVPPSGLLEQYEEDYKFMRENMIYRESPDFDTLIEELRQLNKKFQNSAEVHMKD